MHRHHSMKIIVIALLNACLLFSAVPALADQDEAPAGSVKSVTGEALMVRKGASAVLKPGDRIYEKDTLTTGKTGALGLVLRDNSTLSLGPATSITVERFMFAPEKGELSSITRITRGSVASVSGEITKLRPESSKVVGPGFSIGIRGTHFLISVPPDAEAKEAGGR